MNNMRYNLNEYKKQFCTLKNSIFFLLIMSSSASNACTMFKITKDGKTIVGNNEDWISPNSQFWFEPGSERHFSVMYMGLLNDFAQGAINEKGLVFDGFANPELVVSNTFGKENVRISEAIQKIMRSMQRVEEAKNYLSSINLSSLSSSQLVFVDPSGKYLIVEGDELIIGNEEEKAFSNFYYSQVSSEEEVELDYFQKGLHFLKNSRLDATQEFCGQAMHAFSNEKLFGTQYSTIYNLQNLTVRVYLFHDYSQFVELDLTEEWTKGEHRTMIAELFPKTSVGYQHYAQYNNSDEPTAFLEELIGKEILSEEEFLAMGFNSIINTIGYEWLYDIENTKAAIRLFEYGIQLMPNNAYLYDSLGEAYFVAEDWKKATKYYRKSLDLDPRNMNAKEMLEKMGINHLSKEK